MRDPQAAVHLERDTVVRRLRAPLPPAHFLRSELARRWVEDGRLVPFEFSDECTIVSPRLRFVTQPTEWCDTQLFAAGELTLALQQEAVAAGFDLKDASAWNVIFDGLRPVFCDLTSFVPLESRRWWAAGQFARHFILPLAVSRRRELRAGEQFKVWRDGLPAEAGRRLLGRGRFLTRHWPLVAQGARETPAIDDASERPSREQIERFRAGLHASFAWMLAGARPRPRRAVDGRSAWAGYTEQREHYSAESLQGKRTFVDEALAQCCPEWVADLGCNSGEFSRLALAHGARVVALDGDHDAVDRLFRETPAASSAYPVVCALDDLGGGRGWGGYEYPGLATRLEGSVDMVLMLALVHHLAVSASVPLDAIASLAASWARRWLVVEWIGEGDPQLRRLCRQRQRAPQEFSIAAQRRAFESAGWRVLREMPLAPTERMLALMARDQ